MSIVPGLSVKWPPTYEHIMESLDNPRDIARWRARVERGRDDLPHFGIEPATYDCPAEETPAFEALKSRIWDELAMERQEALRRLLGIPKPPRMDDGDEDPFDPFCDEEDGA
jgi:hypothetical protein